MSEPRNEILELLAEGRRLAQPRRELPNGERPDPAHRSVPTDARLPAAPVARPTANVAKPSPLLDAQWIDDEDMPFEPVRRPGSPWSARLLSVFTTGLLLAFVGWLVIPELSYRISTDDVVVVRDGVLTAQAVQLAPTRPAVVSELLVDPGDLSDMALAKGTPIARLESLASNGERLETTELLVPFDARFVSIDSLVGAVTLPGTPVATVYDPTQMYVIATVRPETLDELRRGMSVELKSDAARQVVTGTVISAVPLLGTEHEPTTSQYVNIKIKPDDDQVVDLVPGIRFDAHIHLGSVPEGATPLVFTSLDGPD